jgi:excisionase family DNA binding protein
VPARDEPLRGIDLMTVPEVARLLRTTPKAIYAMVERGQLPGVLRFNRRVLLDRQVLLDFLRQSSTPSERLVR